MHRDPEVLEAEAQVGKWLDYLKGTCTTPFCEKWHPPEWLFYKSENGCRLGEKCSYAHRQVYEQFAKGLKNDDQSAVAMLKKRELYYKTVKLVVCRDTRHEHHGPVVCN